MPVFFHGTIRSDAVAMAGTPPLPGTINVIQGEGEFGMGFYTQESPSNALTWAQNHRGNPNAACILEIDIPVADYANLNKKQLNLKQAKRLTIRLYANGTRNSHIEGVDVVVGPLNQNRWNEQQKFESQNAGTLLNGPTVQRRVI